jgi:hypothetical protein
VILKALKRTSTKSRPSPRTISIISTHGETWDNPACVPAKQSAFSLQCSFRVDHRSLYSPSRFTTSQQQPECS